MPHENWTEPTVVAVLGLGEAGTALASGLMREWRGADESRRVIAVDTALGDNLRGAAIQDRARELGGAIEGRYTPALADANVVFCAVTGVEARNAARAARAGAVWPTCGRGGRRTPAARCAGGRPTPTRLGRGSASRRTGRPGC